MNEIVYIVVWLARILVSLLSFALFLRAILSWFPEAEDNRFSDFLYTLTEPLIYPMRSLLDRIPFFRDLPIDMASFFTMLLMSLLMSLLGGF